jgi:Fe2+ or Zn2+ uptake regulation protein
VVKHSHSDIHGEVAERLRIAGQRYTTKRRTIIDLLAGVGQPMTIVDLLERKSDLPQSSLYRNLMVLEESGVVAKVVTTGDQARFELAEHLTGHHHHLLCSSCGAVRDVVVPDVLENDLDLALSKLAKKEGFTLDRHRLDLIGRCASCQ